MPAKKKNGKYTKCYWCGRLPKEHYKHTYKHTNIYADPPEKFFCSKKCLDAWVFRENHRIILSFTNLNQQLYLNNSILYKNVRTKY